MTIARKPTPTKKRETKRPTAAPKAKAKAKAPKAKAKATRAKTNVPPRLPSTPRPPSGVDDATARLLIGAVRDYAIFALDASGHVVSWNPGAEAAKGYAPNEILGQRFDLFFTAEDRAAGVPQKILDEASDKGRFVGEGWRVRKDGSRMWTSVSITAIRDEDGTLRGFAKVTRDLTRHAAGAEHAAEPDIAHAHALERAREEQRRTQARLDALERSGLVGVVVGESNGNVVDASDAFLAALGYTRDELVRGEIDWRKATPPEWARAGEEAIAAATRGERAAPFEKEYIRKDGTRVRMLVSVARMPDRSVVATMMDVSRLHRAERALRESHALHAQIVESTREGISVLDRDLRFVAYNPYLEQLTGRARDQAIGRRLVEIRPDLAGSMVEQSMKRALEGIATTLPDQKFTPVGLDHPIWLSVDYVPLRNASGEIDGVLVTSHDVTGRPLADAAVRESDERFRQLAEALGEIFWMTDLARTQFTYVSALFESVFARSAEALRSNANEWTDAIHPDDRGAVVDAFSKQRAGTYAEQYRVVRPDGTIRWIRDRAFPVLDSAGQIVAIAGLAEDITAQHELETRLQQARRMESIGELAGGVAHDFNNLLTVISSNCDLVLEGVDKESETATLVKEIRNAGLRAANLTQQLLAFSRRQFVEPKVVDINQSVTDVKKMIGRLVGKDIEVRTELDANVSRVRVDPTHLGQVLINLAVHAKDGMPSGGRLSLSTRAVEIGEDGSDGPLSLAPGSYVVISVADTGATVTPEMRARMFEPFYSSRVVGRGSGLGLSAVHGMVVQNGGTIEVAAAENGGTIFHVYLPIAIESAYATYGSIPPRSSVGAATILLVEDDPSVRRAARKLLEADGCLVVAARNGVHALEVYRELGTTVDLLLTDVVMPEMGGAELARQMVERQPGLRVLYTSGYTNDAVIRKLVESSAAFLQKPYTRERLLAKVQETLAAPPPA